MFSSESSSFSHELMESSPDNITGILSTPPQQPIRPHSCSQQRWEHFQNALLLCPEKYYFSPLTVEWNTSVTNWLLDCWIDVMSEKHSNKTAQDLQMQKVRVLTMQPFQSRGNTSRQNGESIHCLTCQNVPNHFLPLLESRTSSIYEERFIEQHMSFCIPTA